MPFRAQASYDSGAVKERVRSLLARMKVLSEKGSTSDPDIVSGLVSEYEELVIDLGSPKFKGKPLDPRDTATFQQLQEIFDDADEDIRGLYREIQELAGVLTRSFNLNQAALDGAVAQMNITTALLLTAGVESSLAQRGMFVAADAFKDQSKMNVDQSTAEVGFGGNALTLERTEVIDVLPENAEVLIDADARPIAGAGDVKVLAPYEGRLYALNGEAIPEAGEFKFVNNGKALAPTPAEKLARARRSILDGNPDTFWQVERVLISTDEQEVEPGAIDNNVQYDFEVVMTLKLPEPVIASAFTMDPMNFGERAWLEILRLETSTDGQTWTPIPGLHDHNFYNVLTDEANKQLNSRVANAVMSPSKYSYEGKGLWVFPARELRFIRARIIQRTPIAAPYDVIKVTQKQTVQTTKTSGSILGIGGKKSTKTKTEYRDIELSYIESLAALYGEYESPNTDPSVKANAGINIDIPGVGNVFSSGSKTTSKSGYSYHSSELQQKFNAVRYAVGIRDIGLLNANYEQASTYISKKFEVPTPARQIQLLAEHTIPESFGAGDWVKYFISLDDGEAWDEMAPLNRPPVYRDGARIPTTILVNAGVPEEARDDRFGYRDTGSPVNSVLVKIELSRPGDAQGTSPVVNSYALNILTEETYSPVIV